MISKSQLQAFFDQEFDYAKLMVDSFEPGRCCLRKTPNSLDLRPGGTVSGPTIMGMADAAMFAAIMSQSGLVTMAMTTNLNINFVSKAPGDKDILADARLLKLGKTTAVGEVSIFSDGQPQLVAHAVGNFALPVER